MARVEVERKGTMWRLFVELGGRGLLKQQLAVFG